MPIFTTIGAVAFIGFCMLIWVIRFRRCPSNRVLAVYGRVGRGKSVQCYHGGGAFVWPLIQGYAYLDLIPMTINIPLRAALSLQNIRINVPSTFTVAISTDPDVVFHAAIRLLGLARKEVEAMAIEIILGQLRLTVASLTIEQINQDREKFLESIKHNIIPELKKIGLDLINVNITDIHDESGYIDSIGKKAASTAINQAKVDVAEQEKKGDIGKALAEKERRISVAAYQAEAVEGENKAQSEMARFNADLAEQQAIGKQRSEIAQQNATAEIQTAKALAEMKRLEAEEVVQETINKQKREIVAEASAEQQRREARGKADSILSIREAEATGIKKILIAKADGYKYLIDACDNNAKDATTLLLVEKLEELVKMQTEAIRNLKIDKITVWDNGGNEKGSSTSNFVSSMVKSLPALHDVAAMAGMELPEYLGKISDPKFDHKKKEAEGIPAATVQIPKVKETPSTK
jgi:flotillin